MSDKGALAPYARLYVGGEKVLPAVAALFQRQRPTSVDEVVTLINAMPAGAPRSNPELRLRSEVRRQAVRQLVEWLLSGDRRDAVLEWREA